MLYAPLEQFQILSVLTIEIFDVEFTLSNFFFINLLILVTFFSISFFSRPLSQNNNMPKESSVFFAPYSWQKVMESTYNLSAQLVSDIILVDNEKYFPVILTVFHFILFSNLIGLIPYTFTVTSHVIVTFMLSFSIFIGITLSTVRKYKMQAFSLFLPANSSFFLALILVPIEFISYIARPISLGMRLFINLMAGHSLLKVIIGFSWSMLVLENAISIGLICPMLVVVILFGLELAVALIQTYVFVILACIYIQDGS